MTTTVEPSERAQRCAQHAQQALDEARDLRRARGIPDLEVSGGRHLEVDPSPAPRPRLLPAGQQ